ncbi:hypothetical protein PIB30_006591 [Stylosanthes scabra]|uniref:Uncharacterized protein n=1 Tax=Stylosanthes scabra TaxID=79078 RepID=A0ABU6Y1I7_9FABA|nr:hypothetical protein [Stylosanthes scabra]
MDWSGNRPSIGPIGLVSLSDRLVQLSHVDRRLIRLQNAIPANGSMERTGCNDHPVPPVDAVSYLLALFAGDGILTLLFEYLGYHSNGTWPLWTSQSPRHLTGVNHTEVNLSNRRVREVNRRMSSWSALGPGMHHTCLRI